MFWDQKDATISAYTDLSLDITVHLDDNPRTIDYIAAAPADSRTTFTGSGLPFVSLAQAFWKTPNMGTVTVGKDGSAKVNLAFPNKICPFSMDDIPPTLFYRYQYKHQNQFKYGRVKIADVSVPHRDVRFTQKFQDERLIQSQERTLMATRFGCGLGK